MVGCMIGALVGVLLNLGIPWWLGFKGHSPLWLLLLAMIVFSTLGKNVTTYNIIRAGFTSGRPLRSLFYGLLLPLIFCVLVDLVPYFAGVWMAHWPWLFGLRRAL
jgi:hypothetical protein